ncbi:MAG: zinc-ribbon domain-containing protein [Myxococcaceae bacterium]|nr:zinc-ribbon domain-containing protein [Myxococcaceae bacterium]
MLISCEKCSTTYTLDEALIPASGAPVQCTRCSHVFTAYPPRPDPAALDEEPTTGSRRRPPPSGVPQSRPANQTMVFGTGAAPPPPPPPKASAHQTMVFGTGAAPSQQPPQQPQAPAKASPHQTMVFGTGAPAQPPPAAASPRPSAHQTMMFGTPAGQQLATQPQTAPGSANQTLVFGAGAAQGALPPPAAAPGPKQTVAFGTPAGQQAAAREPGPALAPANQTLVFGQNQAPVPPPGAHPTAVFGTPAGQQLASGQSPATPAARPASATLVFGAGQQPVPPAAQAKPNSTMMFGRPPQVAAAPQPTKTMAFGAPVTVKLDAPELETTEGEGEQRESTVRVDLESMMREHGEEAEPGRQERTQRFAMSDVDPSAAPPSGGDNAGDRHNRTALFAMSTLQETTKPDGKLPIGPTPGLPAPAAKTNPNATAPELGTVGEAFTAQSSDAVTTLPPNALFAQNLSVTDTDPGSDPPGVSTLLEPGFDAKATVRQDQPIASTLPNLPPIGHPATDIAHNPLRLELASNSDLQGVGTQPERPMLQVDMQSEAAAMQAIASQGRRRTVVAVIILLVLVIAGGLAVLWQLFGKQLLAPRTNPQLQQVVVQALEKLRKEDAQVRATELERLESIVKENAGFADGHAALVLALSLQYDDLQAERAVLGVRYDALKKQLEATKDEQKKGELVKRINQLAARSEDLRQPMTDALNKVDRALKAMDAAVKTGSPPAQAARARALTLALRGVSPESSEDTDYWVRLSGPLSKLTNPKSTPEVLKQALSETEALSAEPDTAALPRPHFVAARLLIALGDEGKATAELDKALELSANFTAASELKKLLEKK